MEKIDLSTVILAARITKTASKQTYFTIRYLADRKLINDAYLSYAYFRWVDDILDTNSNDVEIANKLAFIGRQKSLLESCYKGQTPQNLCIEEQMLVDLVHHDSGTNAGLQSYLRNMMGVMEFDANRRGRVISQVELNEYTRLLSTAVTDALYYFIGHDDPVPPDRGRYLSVTAAHITHMLRDTQEDTENGYFNIPGEYLRAHGISEWEVGSLAYHEWVCSRVKLARNYFEAGKEYLLQVHNSRRRLAGYAYTARFEWMLRAIERDNYCLRSEYPERKSIKASLWMGWTVLTELLAPVNTK